MDARALLLWLTALAVLGGGGLLVYQKVRGIRNNNPGNLERTADQWIGLRDEQTDPRFFQFEHARFGIRALGQTLTNYRIRHGLYTVEEIIGRWAPPVENDTASYIASVSTRLDLEPWQVVNINPDGQLPQLVKAIIKHENGIQPYSDDFINDSLALMFLSAAAIRDREAA